MSAIDINEGTGAVTAATGPRVAIAECPATSDSVNGRLPPDDNPPRDADDIDGAKLLGRVQAFACRLIGYSSHLDSITHALWIAHAYLMGSWFTTPRLAVLSEEPGAGKTRVLEVTGMLVPRPILSSNMSPAYIFRKVAGQENVPTILFDEVDSIFGPGARGNEDLRGLINAGYRKGSRIGRCETIKGQIVPVDYPTYAAIALGGLKTLPETIMTRSVILRMRKQPEGFAVEDLDPYCHEPVAQALCQELEAWAESVTDKARSIKPSLPAGLTNRNAEIWRPLIAVADLAGGHWPELARTAAIAAVATAKNNDPKYLLLADIRRCFGDKNRLTTADLLDMLREDEEAPWGDLFAGQRGSRELAKMLRHFGIRPTTIRITDEGPNIGHTPRGYRREKFESVWKKHLPAPGATSATGATSQERPDIPGHSYVADNPPSPPCGGNGGGVAEPEG